MGKLNKFALAPGSLSDIWGASASVESSDASQSLAEDAPAPKPKPKAKKAAPKPAPPVEAETDGQAESAALLDAGAPDASAI